VRSGIGSALPRTRPNAFAVHFNGSHWGTWNQCRRTLSSSSRKLAHPTTGRSYRRCARRAVQVLIATPVLRRRVESWERCAKACHGLRHQRKANDWRPRGRGSLNSRPGPLKRPHSSDKRRALSSMQPKALTRPYRLVGLRAMRPMKPAGLSQQRWTCTTSRKVQMANKTTLRVEIVPLQDIEHQSEDYRNAAESWLSGGFDQVECFCCTLRWKSLDDLERKPPLAFAFTTRIDASADIEESEDWVFVSAICGSCWTSPNRDALLRSASQNLGEVRETRWPELKSKTVE
jgi:hypothetical protein